MSHPNLSVRSASVSLLSYLETINPISVTISMGKVLQSEESGRNSLSEYREDVDNINKLLELCSWKIIILLESLDQTKKTRTQLMEKREEIFAKSAELISASPKSIHLPHEILGLIARYVQPNPLSVKDAAKLRSSSCRWDQILFAHCLIQISDNEPQSHSDSVLSDELSDDEPQSPSDSESLPSLLSASSRANLVVELNRINFTQDQSAQPLLQSRGRWVTLDVGVGVNGETIRKALLELRCPNCPPIDESGKKESECTQHTVLQSVYNLFIRHRELDSFSGMLRNIRMVTIKVIDQTDLQSGIDYSRLAVEAPLLSELTISWAKTSPSFPVAESRPRVLFPKLWRVGFIQEGPTTVREHFEMAFGLLDGSNVKSLYIHDLDGGRRWSGSETEKDLIRFLGEVFPSVETLTLVVETTGSPVPNKLFLELLTPGEHKVLFPQLKVLAIDLDFCLDQDFNFCLDHFEILIPVLRRELKEGVQKIRDLDLYTNLSDEEIARVRETDNFSRIVGDLLWVTFTGR